MKRRFQFSFNILLALLFPLSLWGAPTTPTPTSSSVKKIPPSVAIYLRPEEKKFTLLDSSKENTPWIKDLSEHANKGRYLLLRAAVRTPLSNAGAIFAYFDEKVSGPTCKVNDSYISDFDLGPFYETLNDKTRIFRSCLKFKLFEVNGKKLEYELGQPNCQITPIDDSSLIFSGGGCFFPIKEGEKVSVEFHPDESCLDESLLAEKHILPSSISGVLESYVYPMNEIGNAFAPVEEFDSKLIFLNITPPEKLLKTSASFDEEDGKVLTPDIWAMPDLLISKVRLAHVNKFASVEIGILANSYGPQVCKDGICSGYLHYDIPLAPELQLYEILPSGKEIPLHTTHVGGRLQGKWAGEMLLRTFIKEIEFEKGKKYKISLVFSDPAYDYAALKKTFKSLINANSLGFGKGTRIVGADDLPLIGEIRDFQSIGWIPDLPQTINFKEGIEDGILGSLSKFTKETDFDIFFPPPYSQACDKSGNNCRNIRKGNHLVLSAIVDVKEIEGGKIILSDEILMERKSPILKEFSVKIKKFPEIKCSF